MTYRLSTSGTVTLDGNGYGVLSIGPIVPGLVWNVELLTTSGNSATEPKHAIYRGSGVGRLKLDMTERGNGDVSDTSIRLMPGETLTAEWSEGTTGAVMTLTIEGEINGV